MTELMNGWLMMMVMDRKKYFWGFPFLFFFFFFFLFTQSNTKKLQNELEGKKKKHLKRNCTEEMIAIANTNVTGLSKSCQ